MYMYIEYVCNGRYKGAEWGKCLPPFTVKALWVGDHSYCHRDQQVDMDEVVDIFQKINGRRIL